MDKQSIIQYKTSFDAIASYIEGNSGKDKVEIWFARDLQPLLGYARWENFQVAINRAVESCKTQGVSIDDHFREVTKMVTLGSGATREVQDYMLTRYACYLISYSPKWRSTQGADCLRSEILRRADTKSRTDRRTLESYFEAGDKRKASCFRKAAVAEHFYLLRSIAL